MAEIVSMDQIAHRLGVRPPTVRSWRRRGWRGFPPPAVTYGERRLLWSWPEVEAWAQCRGGGR